MRSVCSEPSWSLAICPSSSIFPSWRQKTDQNLHPVAPKAASTALLRSCTSGLSCTQKFMAWSTLFQSVHKGVIVVTGYDWGNATKHAKQRQVDAQCQYILLYLSGLTSLPLSCWNSEHEAKISTISCNVVIPPSTNISTPWVKAFWMPRQKHRGTLNHSTSKHEESSRGTNCHQLLKPFETSLKDGMGSNLGLVMPCRTCPNLRINNLLTRSIL